MSIMIIIIVTLITFIVALLADWYICRNVLMQRRTRMLYIAVNSAVYLFLVTTSVWYKAIPESPNVDEMRLFAWATWLFTLFASIKYTFVIFSLIGDGAKRLFNVNTLVFRFIGLFFAVIVLAIMIHGTTIGRSKIEVKHIVVSNSKIPKSFDGYKIVQFSDLHIETMINRDKMLANLVDVINGFSPDLVINSGDIVNRAYTELDKRSLMTLGGIRSLDGVYSVLGNHDLGFYVKDSISLPRAVNVANLKQLISGIEWEWLCDSTTTIKRGRDSISLTGITYPNIYLGNGHVSKMQDIDVSNAYDSVAAKTFNISICHAPQLWNSILKGGYGDLTLSGHVHAMQLKVGVGESAISPARLLYKRWSGLYKEGDKTLYINDGIGVVMFPMRVGVRPEITVIELRCKK